MVEQLLAFAAGLVALRLGGRLAARWRARRAPELAAWSGALIAYAVACGALAWGAAAVSLPGSRMPGPDDLRRSAVRIHQQWEQDRVLRERS